MSAELKPCPFCGKRRIYLAEGINSYAWCRNCEACGPERATKEAATEAWNTRAGEKA
ncbi:Lar family restriction alleviation protein [Acetobacter pasteurianus]|uniref:Lar family restriction alleviation protein n=1 Tax=Acetobacter pasteurianus TaxID=438 RepID=UPI000F55283A